MNVFIEFQIRKSIRTTMASTNQTRVNVRAEEIARKLKGIER